MQAYSSTIAKAVERLRQDFEQSLRIEELASLQSEASAEFPKYRAVASMTIQMR